MSTAIQHTPFNRRQFLQMVAGSAAAASMGPLVRAQGRPRAPGAATDRPMNVLMIAVDDLRPQLNCYGRSYMHTPHIDALAESGTLFGRAYCHQGVCAPSRVCLMTGCRPDTTEVHGLRTPLHSVRPDLLTLPQLFRRAGYTTASFGKIYHHPAADDPDGWTTEPWLAPGGWRPYLLEENNRLIEEQKQQAERGEIELTQWGVFGPPYEAADEPDEAYPDGQVATRAIEEMNRVKDDPFFLAVGFIKPHLPFNCPQKYWDMYPEETLQTAPNPHQPKGAPDVAMHTWGELRNYWGVPREGPLTEQMIRTLTRGYYACVSHMDAQVGRVMAALDELGLREKTLVVFWADHGFHLGENGLWCKHSNFELSTQCPLIFSGPSVPEGLQVDALTEFVDVYPSICELTGHRAPQYLEGASVVPLLNDPGRPWKRGAFSEYPRRSHMGRSVRGERFRFTRWTPREGEGPTYMELYDHSVDPQENCNVADDPDYADALVEMTALLDEGWSSAMRR